MITGRFLNTRANEQQRRERRILLLFHLFPAQFLLFSCVCGNMARNKRQPDFCARTRRQIFSH